MPTLRAATFLTGRKSVFSNGERQYCTGRPLARRDYQGPRRALGRVTRRTSQAGSFPFVVDSC